MLIHYIIVRSDLPLGVICAQVAHAAGESAAHYRTKDGDIFRGSVAVVLGVKNESKLNEVADMLFREPTLQHVYVFESSPPYNGQLMAIGLYPLERDLVGDKLSSLQLLRSCVDLTSTLDNPVGVGLNSLNPTNTTELKTIG